jgi:hypothetical protein
MPITLNGTTGVVTPGATIGSINGILKSSSGVVSQASVGTDYSQLTLATAQSASGTAVDFTGIPSWAKRITVILNGTSINSAANYLVQIGSGSIISSGYSSSSSFVSSSAGSTNSTSGFVIVGGFAPLIVNGTCSICLIATNSYVSSHTLGCSNVQQSIFGGGSVTLSGTLDRIRITTPNGTDTFDAGTINISYE